MGKLVKISATLVAMVCFFAFVGCEEPADTPTTKPDTTVKVEKVELNQAKLELTAGENKTLEATVTPANATDRTVTWTSSDDKVATVKDGKVTAVAEGTATITAEAGGKKAECTVSVKAKTYSLTSTKGEGFTGTVTFKVGDKEVAEAAANDEVTIVVTNTDASKEVVFEVKSGNDTISVTNRTFKMPAGDVTVKVFYKVAADPAHTTHTYGNWGYKDANTHWRRCEDPACGNDPKTEEEAHNWGDDGKCSVCHGDKPVVLVTRVVIEDEDAIIEIATNGTKTLEAHVEPAEADQTITWESDSEDVATVDENGVVTGHKGGTATITAKAAGDESKTTNRIVRVLCAKHNYTDNGDGTHGGECSICHRELEATDHQFGDDDVCGCGAHKPLSEFKVIKGKNGDIESMTGTPSALAAYKKNLEKYSFKTVEDDNGWQVTCEVNVTELQTATDGGAKNRKNIVAVLEFDELKAFAIGNISIKRDGTDDTVLGDTSWVRDAELFVDNVDGNKTYVTLWMSMAFDANDKIPDRTYEIKAYADDPNPKTLTFKFEDTSPAPEYKITEAEVKNMQINGAENELVKVIAESVGSNVTVEGDTVTVTFNKSKTEMRKLMSDNRYSPFDPLYLVLTTDIPDTVTAGDSEAAAGKFVFTKGYGWDDDAHHEFNFKDGKIMLWLSANGDNEIAFKVGDVEKTITIKYEYSGSTTTEGKKIEVLKVDALNDTVSTITGDGAGIYKNNLAYYEFGDVKTLSNGNYEVTCEINVVELKEAKDGGAVGYKNIVGVVAFDKISDFAIGSVSRVTREEVTPLSDASWVSDASEFVKTADDSKTYVTLWMSMNKNDNNVHSLSDRRTYEFKLGNDVRTLTVNFKAK